MHALIHFTLDPFSRRIRLALSEYRVPAELINEDPWKQNAALLDLNPAGTIPIFMENANTPICGVEAIGEFLEETKSGLASLIPGTSFERAEIRRLLNWFDTKFYTEVSEPVLTEKLIRRFLPPEQGGGGPDVARVRRAMSRLRGHLAYVAHLADRRPWLAGNHFSMADLAAAAHLSAVDYFGGIPWADYPAAESWYQRMKSRPSFRPLLADTVRGAPPAPHYANLDF